MPEPGGDHIFVTLACSNAKDEPPDGKGGSAGALVPGGAMSGGGAGGTAAPTGPRVVDSVGEVVTKPSWPLGSWATTAGGLRSLT